MFNKLVPLFFASLTLSGCSTALVVSSGAPEIGKEDKRKVVLADLSSRAATPDFSGQATPWSEAEKKFTIARSDPIHAFEEGRSYFKIVRLPEAAGEQTLNVQSYYSLDFPTTLFVPAFLFLDSSRQILTKDTMPAFRIVNGFGEHIELSVGIPSGASYVVIFTTPARVAERMHFQTYRMTGAAPVPAFDSKETTFGGFYEGILRLRLTKN